MEIKNILILFIILLFTNEIQSQSNSNMSFDEVIEFCKLSPSEAGKKKGFTDCIESSYFPNFILKDIYGNEIDLSKMRGVVIINYWFISCPPCSVEKIYLKKLSDKFPNINLISIGLDNKNDILNYKNLHHLPNRWKYISDAKSKNIYNNGFGYPLTIFVYSDGRILKFLLGGIQTDKIYSELNSFFEKVDR